MLIPGALKKVFFLLYAVLPPYWKIGFIKRCVFTACLCILIFTLVYAKVNDALPIIKGILSFSPFEYAENLYNQHKLKSALDYIEFYNSIPGAYNEKLAELGKKIEGERTLVHHLGEMGRIATGKESDEEYAAALDTAFDLTPIGDVRDLYREWGHYSTGQDIDKLSAGLSGLGLLMTLGEIFPPTTAFAGPARAAISVLRKSLKVMNAKMRKALMRVFEPLLNKLNKMHIFSDFSLTSLASIKKTAVKKAAVIEDLIAEARRGFVKLGDFTGLAIKNPYGARVVAKSASSIDELARFSQVAVKMGPEASPILRYGGREALEAGAALEKRGALTSALLKSSMRYGDDGLKAAGKGIKMERLVKIVNRIKSGAIYMGIFLFLWYLSRLPLVIVLPVCVCLCLIILKLWTGMGILKRLQRGRAAC